MVWSGSLNFSPYSFLPRHLSIRGVWGRFATGFARTGWPGKPDSTIQVWVYENVSFELAQNVETQTFPWTEEGVEQIKDWLNGKLAQRGTEPYRIPYPAPKAKTEA